mgnify:FL=1
MYVRMYIYMCVGGKEETNQRGGTHAPCTKGECHPILCEGLTLEGGGNCSNPTQPLTLAKSQVGGHIKGLIRCVCVFVYVHVCLCARLLLSSSFLGGLG